jgi:hypothetical protein
MQGDHAALLKTLHRVQQLLDDSRHLLADFITPTLFANVAATRERLREHESAQDAHSVQWRLDTAAGNRRRAELLLLLRAIQITARERSLAIPELAPLSEKSPPRAARQLVTRARAIATAAEQHERALLAGGLDPGFIARVRAAADALEMAIDASGRSRTLRAAATAGVKAEARNARTLLRLLDTLVRVNVSDPVLLAAWDSASHVDAVRTLAAADEIPAIAPPPQLRALPAGPAFDADAPALAAPPIADQVAALASPPPERWLKRLARTFAPRSDDTTG